MTEIAERISKFDRALVEEARHFVAANFLDATSEQKEAQVLTYCTALYGLPHISVPGAGDLRGHIRPLLSPEYVARLAEVQELLSGSLPRPRGRWQWLCAPNRILKEPPITALAVGRYDDVHAAAQAFDDGSFV